MQELQGLCMQLSINYYSWNDIRRSNFMLNMAVRLHSFLQTLHLQTLLVKKYHASIFIIVCSFAPSRSSEQGIHFHIEHVSVFE